MHNVAQDRGGSVLELRYAILGWGLTARSDGWFRVLGKANSSDTSGNHSAKRKSRWPASPAINGGDLEHSSKRLQLPP